MLSSRGFPDPAIKHTSITSSALTQCKESTVQGTWVRSLNQEDFLEKEMATHSSILAWEIPWTEELSELRSIGLQEEPDMT